MDASFLKMITDSLDRLNQGLSIFDQNLNLVLCNSKAQIVLDLPDELMLEGTSLEIIFRYNARRGEYGEGPVETLIQERIELARRMETHVFERVRPDGSVIEIKGEPLQDGGFVTTYTDVTDQRLDDELNLQNKHALEKLVKARTKKLIQRENELASKSEALETILEYISQGITMMDENFNLVVSNSRFHELAEIPVSLGKKGTPFKEFMKYNAERGEYGEGNIEEQVNLRVELAKKREPHCFERLRPDGTVLEVQGVPLPNGGFVSTYSDITERKKSEKKLREAYEEMEQNVQTRTAQLYDSEQALKKTSEQLKISLENMSQGISYVSNDLEMVFCNEKFLELLDFPKEYAKAGTPFEAYIRRNAERGEYGPGDIEEQVYERVRLAKKRTPHFFDRIRPDGTIIEIRGVPVLDGGFVTTYTDVTVTKNAENALRKSKKELETRVEERTRELLKREKESEEKTALLEATVEHITQGISVFDKNLELLVFNERFINELKFPKAFGKKGTTLETLFRYNAERGEYGEGNVEEQVKERLNLARDGVAHNFERRRPDGTVLQIVGRKMPENIGGFVTTYTNITELVKTQEKLAEASKAKSDFLSGMSHELRTPLNGIIGFAQLLEYHPTLKLEEKQKEYVSHITKSGEHLLELINDILDLSKVESGHLVLNFENINLTDLLNECLLFVQNIANDKGVIITHNLSENIKLPYVFGDILRLKQVLMNLLSNAIKYNVEMGTVKVMCRLAVDEGFLCIEIKDSGVGMPEDLQVELFKPFSRLNAETTDVEGTGLGLSITHKLIESMNGKISFKSIEGKGSTFWLYIPLAQNE